MGQVKKYRVISTILIIVVLSIVVFLARNVQHAAFPQTGIYGRVMRASDISTIPDSPIPGALVLAIRSDNLNSLVGRAEDVRKVNPPWDLSFRIDQELFTTYVVAYVITDKTARYVLQVPQGIYWLCLANIFSFEPQTPGQILPVNVLGCIEVTVEEGKQVKQNIFQNPWGGITP